MAQKPDSATRRGGTPSTCLPCRNLMKAGHADLSRRSELKLTHVLPPSWNSVASRFLAATPRDFALITRTARCLRQLP